MFIVILLTILSTVIKPQEFFYKNIGGNKYLPKSRGQYHSSENVFSSLNIPGGRALFCSCQINSDSPNSQYIFFGGYGFMNSSTRPAEMMNEIWIYGEEKDEDEEGGESVWMWKWVKSFKREMGEIGPEGVYGKEYYPSVRNDMGCVGMDNVKEFYVFGGLGRSNGYLNEMWVMDYSMNSSTSYQWKYLRGGKDQKGDYINGVISSRRGMSLLKLDEESFITLGGWGFDSFGTMMYGYLNGLWLYTLENQTWSIIKAIPGYNKAPIYDKVKVYNESNRISSRSGYSIWRFKKDCVVVFGGFGYWSTVAHGLNDLWFLNITNWNWKVDRIHLSMIGEPNIVGEFHEVVRPRHKYHASLFSMYDENYIYLFGGNYNSQKPCKDLFVYDTQISQWKVLFYDDVVLYSTYGTAGEFYLKDQDKMIGARESQSIFVFDRDQAIIFFGNGYNMFHDTYLNDLWVIKKVKECFGVKEYEENVCNGHGKCIFDLCECDDNYYGNDCSLSSCNNIISNDSSGVICNGGTCIEPDVCMCIKNYRGKYCEITPFKGFVQDYYYIFIFVPVVIIVLLVLCILVIVCTAIILYRQKSKLKKFSKLKDLNIILEEQEMLEKNSNIAHLRINKSLFEIKYDDDVKILKVLGEGGSNSTVYLCEYLGKKAAFKCFRSSDVFNSQHDFQEFEKELSIIASIAHQNILIFYGAVLKPPKIGILTELCEKGDLKMFILRFKQNGISLPLREKIRLLTEIISAVAYLHTKNIIHRDIKPDNILIDDNCRAKLMDFGLSKLVVDSSSAKTRRVGTNFFMAPELLTSKFYNEKVDIYSYGILCLVVITENFFPYGQSDLYSIESKLIYDSTFRPAIDEAQFKDCKWLIELINECWNVDFRSRPSAKEIYKELTKMSKSLNLEESNQTLNMLKSKIDEKDKILNTLKSSIDEKRKELNSLTEK